MIRRRLKELIEYARANPSRINYASSAGPFQMAAELFNQRTGTAFAHIPYKGSGDSVSATMTGEVTMTLSDPAPIAGPRPTLGIVVASYNEALHLPATLDAIFAQSVQPDSKQRSRSSRIA